jgi:leucine dehydrogenase
MSPESLHLRRGPNLEMIIAIDSTRLGPALGGCRWKPYPEGAAAGRADACALAAAMTRKAALARVRLGGGKAVVIGDPRRRTRQDLLAFGDFVESLGGRYVTGADMGTSASEMAVIAERTRHVVGMPEHLGGCGEPAPYTALGVELALRAALADSGRDLAGLRVVLQGVGRVGSELAQLLLAAGAKVAAADPSRAALDALPEDVERVAVERVLELDCDVLAPCGPPRVITREVAERLRCAVVCGAANNPLADAAVAAALDARGILYVPDFIANAGGLIHLAVARDGGSAADSREHLRVIPENVTAVLSLAKSERIDPAQAAETLAQRALAR